MVCLKKTPVERPFSHHFNSFWTDLHLKIPVAVRLA